MRILAEVAYDRLLVQALYYIWKEQEEQKRAHIREWIQSVQWFHSDRLHTCGKSFHVSFHKLDVITKIDALSDLSDGWNGRDALAPSQATIENAKRWIQHFYSNATTADLSWSEPLATASADGEIVFEWWKEDKKLTVYIQSNEAQYIKVWGDDIEDMEDGEINSDETIRVLWTWLMS